MDREQLAPIAKEISEVLKDVEEDAVLDKLDSHEMIEAFRMRSDGESYQEIASELESSIDDIVDMIYRHSRATPEEPMELSRNLQLARLDEAYRAIRPDILAGNLKAVNTMLKIMDRQAKLLGLDADRSITIDKRTTDDVRDMTDEELLAIIHKKNG